MSRLTEDLALGLEKLSRLVLSQPIDKTAEPKISVRPVTLRGRRLYQVERFRDNKAFHENLEGESLLRLVEADFDGRYRQALLVTEEESAQYSMKAGGDYKRHGGAAVPRPAPTGGNNREKQYLLPEGEPVPALVDLGVFTPDYRIVRAKYDKYRQINRFLELIDQAFRDDGREELTVLDFGCGKSYLTFILYYYFAVKQGRRVRIIGYDLKKDVVEHCNAVAEKYGYTGLRFVHADVSRDALYGERVDMIVTLHACDTATDYALHYAIQKGADYIFSVPCCQHEVNLQMKKGGELDVFLRHYRGCDRVHRPGKLPQESDAPRPPHGPAQREGPRPGPGARRALRLHPDPAGADLIRRGRRPRRPVCRIAPCSQAIRLSPLRENVRLCRRGGY